MDAIYKWMAVGWPVGTKGGGIYGYLGDKSFANDSTIYLIPPSRALVTS